ncbi:Crp/Fnr family transcriptional regulator [Foetidibacter luteolus]|uniref:Crp/Fnr family transcriptional regulator n=1 Tax=Foetidibacter luteolus TaxID=2608880 RepID=UPI00129B627E|nr:cyclic nucleotide-binding domain-containing protein [Foetidibacter luteolus]
MIQLFKLLDDIHLLPDALRGHLKRILKPERFKKKSYLLQAGQSSSRIYFIERGLARCFYEEKGSEINKWFAAENHFLFAPESFIQQVESDDYIQALEDLVVHSISKQELYEIYDLFPCFERHGRVIALNLYMRAEILANLRRGSSAERYNKLLATHPELVLRVRAKDIASYLDIEPSWFSKIKGAAVA